MQLQDIQKKTSFDLSALFDIYMGERPHIFPEIGKGGQYIYLTSADMSDQSNLSKYGFSPDTRIAFLVSDQDQLVAFVKAADCPAVGIALEQLATGTYEVFTTLASLISDLCQRQQSDSAMNARLQFEHAENLFFSDEVSHLVGQPKTTLISLLTRHLMVAQTVDTIVNAFAWASTDLVVAEQRYS